MSAADRTLMPAHSSVRLLSWAPITLFGEVMYRYPRRHGIYLFSAIALLAAIGAVPAAAQTGERCFPETGLCIAGPIRAFWERNGGLPVFGFPITPQHE